MNTAARLPYHQLAPEAFRALLAVGKALAASTIEKKLIDLVSLRISQINGCAYCVNTHANDLLAQNESMQRMNRLVTWREDSLFSARERAALIWAESLTLVKDTRAPDADYDELLAHFSVKEVAELTISIAQMNAWNRIGVGMRVPAA